MGKVSNFPYINVFHHGSSLQNIASIELPLPDPETVIQDSYDLAFPQVVAWSTAAGGILLVVMLIRSFTNK